MSRLSLCTFAASALLLVLPAALPAQEAAVTTTPPVSVVPHLIKFSGALASAPSKAETVEVKFALYAAQTGGEALWTETQQVTLDSTGKYSVLLGSSAALPDSAFAQGQARWIGVTLGGEQESARTVLVATPYSLKASDAETLGGHPVSDFTLKNALPAGGTNITQINVGNGVTGGGTGPTVTLGLSSSYLETLGNGLYPQLHGTNTFSGKNTFTAGDLLLGSAPVLATTSVLGTSPITATVSGNTVKIGISNTSLLTLGNEVYAQFKIANTFLASQTINTSTGYALIAESTGAGAAGVTAGDLTPTAAGVVGTSDVGLFGTTPGGLTYNMGTLGGYGDLGSEFFTESDISTSAGVGTGAWGDGGDTSTIGNGIEATTDTGNAIVGYTAAPYAVIYGVSDYSGSDYSYLLSLSSSATGDSCVIDGSANLSCTGSFAVSNKTPDKHLIETYNMQSSENWIEDFGSGQLESGHAVVTLDATFAKIVNTGVEYHVFLTPKGESENLYVTNESPTGFEVREARGGSSTIAFDFRIVAKRTGKETVRLTDVTGRTTKNNPSLLADMMAKKGIHPAANKRPAVGPGGVRLAHAVNKQ